MTFLQLGVFDFGVVNVEAGDERARQGSLASTSKNDFSSLSPIPSLNPRWRSPNQNAFASS